MTFEGHDITELSSGELQRLRLATQFRAGLFGVVYVLDEPSAGLHPADAEALYAALRRLVAAGNSLFVVELDMEVVAASDWVIELGPGGGDAGGSIVAANTPRGLAGDPRSVSAEYLARALA